MRERQPVVSAPAAQQGRRDCSSAYGDPREGSLDVSKREVTTEEQHFVTRPITCLTEDGASSSGRRYSGNWVC